MGCLEGICLHPKEKELKSLQSQSFQAGKYLGAQQNMKKQKQRQIDNLNKNINSLIARLQSSKSQILGKNAEIQTLTKVVDELTNQSYSTRTNKNNNQNTVILLEQRLSELQTGLPAYQNSNSAIQYQNEASQELKLIEDQIKQSEQQLRRKDQLSKKQQKSQNKNIQNLNKELGKKNKDTAKLKREIKDLQNELNKIQSESSKSVIQSVETGMLDSTTIKLIEEYEPASSAHYLDLQDFKFK